MKVTGATVHLVNADLDAGPIVLQAAVPVFDHDTADTLAARILAEEHLLYPAAIARMLDGGWRIDGRRVVFSEWCQVHRCTSASGAGARVLVHECWCRVRPLLNVSPALSTSTRCTGTGAPAPDALGHPCTLSPSPRYSRATRHHEHVLRSVR